MSSQIKEMEDDELFSDLENTASLLIQKGHSTAGKQIIEIINRYKVINEKLVNTIKTNTVSDGQKYDDSKSADYYDSPFNGVFQG